MSVKLARAANHGENCLGMRVNKTSQSETREGHTEQRNGRTDPVYPGDGAGADPLTVGRPG
jgi:hypothetical protein